MKRAKKAQKKQRDTAFITALILFIAFLFSASMVCGALIFLSILPLRYFSIVLAATIVIAAVFGFFVFFKKFNHVIKAITAIVETIFVIAYIAAFIFLITNVNLISSLQFDGYQTEEFYVVSLKDASFNSINSLDGHRIATYQDSSDAYKDALKELGSLTNATTTEYEDIIDASGALLDSNVDAVLLKGAMYEIVDEILPDFADEKTRIVYTISIKTALAPTTTRDLNISEDSFNLLISGIDTRGDVSTVSRSDVNMIVTVNPRTNKILLTSIPRDYYVQLHNITGIRDKLTHAGLYGVNMSIETIEDLFGIDIDYYLRLNFDSTERVINALDGIYITPDFTFTVSNGHGGKCSFTADRPNYIDGACGLAYARTRKVYSDGDFHRILNQQEVLVGIIDKLMATRSYSAFTNFLATAEGNIETNVPNSQIYKLINLQLDKTPSWSIERISVGGTSTKDYTYTVYNEITYVVEPDMNSVQTATNRINEIFAENPAN